MYVNLRIYTYICIPDVLPYYELNIPAGCSDWPFPYFDSGTTIFYYHVLHTIFEKEQTKKETDWN